jgi:hypothetical protein
MSGEAAEKVQLRRSVLRKLGRFTVSAALVAWRHFFVAPLASRTTQYAPGSLLPAALHLELFEQPE